MKPLIKTTLWTWAGILLAQFLLFYRLSKSEAAVLLAGRGFEAKKHVHQSLFYGLNFSVGDVLYLILIPMLIAATAAFFIRKYRKSALSIILITINLLYPLYQLCWGMLYFEPPVLSKLPADEPTLQETKIVAQRYLQKCISTRQHVHEDRNGVFKINDFKTVEAEVLRQQAQLPTFTVPKSPTNIKNFKPSIYRKMLSYTGIYGYYNPFTAEAQYDAELPATAIPFTLAHESAHQLGYAREQEANFTGYLIGKNSKVPDLKYSTELFVLKSLLININEHDPAFVKSIINKYSPAMKRDRLFERNFARRHAGPVDALFSFTNDLFLKSNQQDGSVTYNYFTDLLLRYERLHP